jgi:hypothetical protein
MRARSDTGQLSLVGVVIALIVMGALTGIGLVVFVGGSDSGGTAQGPQGPGVSTADNAAAQQSLSQAQTAASTAIVGGGYGTLTASTLTASDPSLTFTSGASTSSGTVSVAPGGGATSIGGGPTAEGLTGAPSTGLGTATATGAGGGSVTLAAYAKTGTCWYVWLGRGGPRYGAETGRSSCQAAPIATAPPASAPNAASVGWSSSTFPPT